MFLGSAFGDKGSCIANVRDKPMSLPCDPPPLLRVTPVVVLKGHVERVWCVSWCPTADVIASCSGDGTVKLWGRSRHAAQDNDEQRLEWECICTLKGEHSRTVRHVSWSPSGEYIACASFDRTTSVWKRTSADPGCFDFELEAILEGHESEVKCAAWLTDTTLATCSRDRTVWVWDRVDAGEFECAGVLAGHAQDVKACAWIPPLRGDEKPLLLSCSYDNTVKVWTESHQRDDWYCFQTITRHNKTVWCIAVQPVTQSIEALRADEEEGLEFHSEHQPLVCCCSDDNSVTFWSRNSEGKFQAVCTAMGFAERSIYSVCWGPGRNNAIVACGSGDNKITLLGLYSSKGSNEVHVSVLAEVPFAHDADVNSVAFSSMVDGLATKENDTLLLASGGDDNMVRIWSVKKTKNDAF